MSGVFRHDPVSTMLMKCRTPIMPMPSCSILWQVADGSRPGTHAAGQHRQECSDDSQHPFCSWPSAGCVLDSRLHPLCSGDVPCGPGPGDRPSASRSLSAAARSPPTRTSIHERQIASAAQRKRNLREVFHKTSSKSGLPTQGQPTRHPGYIREPITAPPGTAASSRYPHDR